MCGCWFIDAILGAKKKVSTVDGDVEVEVAAGTQPNAKIRLDVRTTHPPTRQTWRQPASQAGCVGYDGGAGGAVLCP